MAEQADQQVPDVMQFWRDWLTQSERQFNAFFAQSMNTEPFARSVGGYMEMYATFQRMMAQGMERYLALINIPSRTDVIGLGEAMRAMDERLARIDRTTRYVDPIIAAPYDVQAATITRAGGGSE